MIKEMITNKKCICVCDICGKEQIKWINECNNSFSYKHYKKHICKHCYMKFANQIGIRDSSKIITAYNKSTKGKTLEQRLGKQKAQQIKQKISLSVSGENNPMYGKNYQTYGIVEYAKSLTGKTFEQIHGVKKANQLKRKISLSLLGENNPMYGKPAPQGSGNGWSGWYKQHYFRSLLELSFILNNPDAKSAEYLKIPYISPYNNVNKTYSPDFILEKTNVLIEIKPKKLINTKTNKAKYVAAKKYCKQHHMKFKVITEIENPINYDLIEKLYLNNEIMFLERYDIKMKEFINRKINNVKN